MQRVLRPVARVPPHICVNLPDVDKITFYPQDIVTKKSRPRAICFLKKDVI